MATKDLRVNQRINVLEKSLQDAHQSLSNISVAMQHLLVGSQKEIDRLDLIARSATYVLKEVFGHQIQLEAYITVVQKRLGGEPFELPPVEELEKATTEWYHQCFGSTYKQVIKERQEERERFEELAKAALESAKAAKEAQTSAAEQARAEAELIGSEKNISVSEETGGPGSDIPEGATIFGG